MIRSERRYGSLYRSFSLPQEIDLDGATAKYKDGILELNLPKKAGSQTAKLTVQ